MTCAECHRPMRESTDPKQPGDVVHRARGMCNACHRAATRAGRLHTIPTIPRRPPNTPRCSAGCGRRLTTRARAELGICWVCNGEEKPIGQARHDYPAIAEDAAWLHDAGETLENILHRLGGITDDTLKLALTRTGNDHLWPKLRRGVNA